MCTDVPLYFFSPPTYDRVSHQITFVFLFDLVYSILLFQMQHENVYAESNQIKHLSRLTGGVNYSQ